MIGTEGTYLSGGEAQRVALARAILKDAPIVVLDEATAFADPENEALIQKAFAQLTKDRTVIMIAHRLSTVVGADRILVLEGGRVTEQGTHGELIAAGGLYTRMWADYNQAIQWKMENGKEEIMFGANFQRKYALTDQGVQNTKKGTFWTVIVNLVVMGGVSILYLVMSGLMETLTDDGAAPARAALPVLAGLVYLHFSPL